MVLGSLLMIVGIAFLSGEKPETETAAVAEVDDITQVRLNMPKIYPVEHASFVMDWAGEIIYVDPVGEPASYTNQGLPNTILITHGHGDHFDLDLLLGVVTESVKLVVPGEVYAKLPTALQNQAIIMKNDDTNNIGGVMVAAVPMYNTTPEKMQYHVKGVGNGYVLEKNGVRVYVAGDTEDIPEMRALEGIDIAFVPMNEPYTMSVEAAADAVLAFAPKLVYPYHLRGPDGLSDIDKFTELVSAGNPAITVVDGSWYASQVEQIVE